LTTHKTAPSGEAMTITLRYFDMSGRAQPLRDVLACAGVPFEDLRLSMADWSSRRDDPQIAGPHGSLPTLTWNGQTIGETIPIASFLARRLGERDAVDDVSFSLREGVVSSAYLEVIARLGELVWASLIYPGADTQRAFATIVAPRMLAKLERIDAHYADGAALSLPRAKPCVADFFAREALTLVRRVLGGSREERIRARLPHLFELDAWLASQPALANARTSRPVAFTARPDEDAVIAALRGVDLSAAGV
jgi:glutathione S-transferase